MTLRTSKTTRAISFLVYAFLCGAGIQAVAAPPESMAATSAHIVIVVWAFLMAGAGLAGMYSVLTGNILPELVGLPALFLGVLVFVVVLVTRAASGQLPSISGSVVLALLLLGFAGLLLVRIIELFQLVRAIEKRM